MDKAINGIEIGVEFENNDISFEYYAEKLKQIEKAQEECSHDHTEKTMNLRWGKQLVVDRVVEGISISKMVSVLEQMEVCQACGKAIWVPVPNEECL